MKEISEWLKENWLSFLVLLIGAALFCYVNYKIGNIDAFRAEIQKVEKKQAQIDSIKNKVLLAKDSTFVISPAYLELSERIAEVKAENASIDRELVDRHQNSTIEQLRLWTFIGVFFGGLIAFFGIRKYAESRVLNELSKITGINPKKLGVILKNKLTNQELREQSKIIILKQRESILSAAFRRIMELFLIDAGSSDNVIVIDGLNDLEGKRGAEIKELVRLKDILIIEDDKNEDGSSWNIRYPNGQPITIPEKNRKGEIRTNAEKEILEKKAEIRKDEGEKNAQYLINFADSVCSDVSIFYYGQGRFPSGGVQKHLRHKISFANTPSQLYQNLNNLLQLNHELNKKDSFL